MVDLIFNDFFGKSILTNFVLFFCVLFPIVFYILDYQNWNFLLITLKVNQLLSLFVFIQWINSVSFIYKFCDIFSLNNYTKDLSSVHAQRISGIQRKITVLFVLFSTIESVARFFTAIQWKKVVQIIIQLIRESHHLAEFRTSIFFIQRFFDCLIRASETYYA